MFTAGTIPMYRNQPRYTDNLLGYFERYAGNSVTDVTALGNKLKQCNKVVLQNSSEKCTGKTHLALKYLHRSRLTEHASALWVDCSNAETFSASIRDIDMNLNYSPKISESDLSSFLAAQENWLLIFDNVTAATVPMVVEYLSNERGKFLLTSRLSQQELEQSSIATEAECVEVPEFSQDELATFFREYVGTSGDSEDVAASEKFVTEVAKLDMSVVKQAAQYMKQASECRYDICEQYLKRETEIAARSAARKIAM
tara:strand:- start:4851 stop:5618 length:768 start_codon:yes stop_codon:yes gene_type:complete